MKPLSVGKAFWIRMQLTSLIAIAGLPAIAAEPPAEIAAPGMKVALSVHAIGAQIYVCAARGEGTAPQWTFANRSQR